MFTMHAGIYAWLPLDCSCVLELRTHWLSITYRLSLIPTMGMRTAVDLQSTDGKGHAVLQGVEELGRSEGGGTGVGLEDIPTRDHVAGGELLCSQSESRKTRTAVGSQNGGPRFGDSEFFPGAST